LLALLFAPVLLLIVTTTADSQEGFRIPGMPLPTTLVVQKPTPEQGFGSNPVIELSIGGESYRFIRRDFWVDDPQGLIMGGDVLRQVELSRPNMLVEGPDANKLAKLEPGQTATVTGMYSMTTRSLTVNSVQGGNRPFQPGKRY